MSHGRPAAGKHKRSHVVKVYLTAAERLQLDAACAARGVGLAELLRSAGLQSAATGVGRVTDPKAADGGAVT